MYLGQHVEKTTEFDVGVTSLHSAPTALRHAVTLTFDLSTLNVFISSAVTQQATYERNRTTRGGVIANVSNLCAIRHPGFGRKWILKISWPLRTHNASVYQHSAKSGNTSLSYIND